MRAAFLRVCAVAQIGEVVVKTAEEKCTKTPSLPIDAGEGFESQQTREESLDGILGIGGRKTPPAGVGIKGRPVNLAKIRQRDAAIFEG